MEDQNKVVNDTASFDGDPEPILPDGWKEGDQISAEGDDELMKLFADGEAADSLPELENDDAIAADGAPTTGSTSGASVPDAGAQSAQTPPDGAGSTQPSASRKLTLKVNHEEREVDIGSMSDDDLRALLQKGMAFDAMKDAENKRTYRQVYQEQIDAGMTDAAARMIARDAAGGNTYATTDEEEAQMQKQAAPLSEPPEYGTPKTRDLRAEVEQLRALYPDMKEMPDEVAKAVSKGIPLMTAYLAYREKQNAQTAANLRKENTILKQNAANAAKAPVRGVTGGDNAQGKGQSLWEKGFDAGFNWG